MSLVFMPNLAQRMATETNVKSVRGMLRGEITK